MKFFKFDKAKFKPNKSSMKELIYLVYISFIIFIITIYIIIKKEGKIDVCIFYSLFLLQGDFNTLKNV